MEDRRLPVRRGTGLSAEAWEEAGREALSQLRERRAEAERSGFASVALLDLINEEREFDILWPNLRDTDPAEGEP